MDNSSKLPELLTVYLDSFTREAGDVAGRHAAQTYLDTSTAIYQGHLMPFSFIPKIFDMQALIKLDNITQKTYSILEKVTQQYLDDPSYRRLFEFSPELERLICLPTGYRSLIPIMRMDIFLNEETLDFWFCEFNTDGTSAMNEDREGANALWLSPTCKNVVTQLRLELQELFEGWVDEFLSIYQSSELAVSKARLAIVDYAQSATTYEFDEFRKRFERRGIECMICNIPELEYYDGALYGIDVDVRRALAGKQRIDVLYRRAVTAEVLSDLLESPSENRGVRALIKAVENRSVCMIGGFVSHVAHSKQLFAVLHLPQTAAFLTCDELAFIKKHVPFTTCLEKSCIDLEEVRQNKDGWIIKPEDGYGSSGVYAGLDHSPDEWKTLIDTCSALPYVVQAYCPQYATPNTRVIPLSKDSEPLIVVSDETPRMLSGFKPTALDPWNNLTGLFLYNGRFSGIYSRAGQKGIIVSFAGGVAVPTFLSGYDPDVGLALRTRPL